MPCFIPAEDWTRIWGRSDCGLISETRCISTAEHITICGWRLARIYVSRKNGEGISGARRVLGRSFYLTGKAGAGFVEAPKLAIGRDTIGQELGMMLRFEKKTGGVWRLRCIWRKRFC